MSHFQHYGMSHSYDTNLDTLVTHFDILCLFCEAQTENFGNLKRYDCEDLKKIQFLSKAFHILEIYQRYKFLDA
jgi:hypothetical protein